MKQAIQKQEQVREKIKRLTIGYPKYVHIFLQEIFTWITGKPYEYQQPLIKQTALGYLTLALTELALGTIGSFLILKYSILFYLLLPATFLLTVGGARILETTIIHQCVHLNFYKSSRVRNRLLAELLSTLIGTEHFDGYYYNHVRKHHNRKAFATFEDPAYKLILKLGFYPGRSKREYGQCLIKAIFSPSFHLSLLKERLISNFLTSPFYRRVMSIIWIIGCFSFALATENLVIFLIVWVFPLTLLHNISALLHALTEHIWGYEDEKESQQVVYLRRTCGRFCGELPPNIPIVHNPSPWFNWGVKLLFIHLPIRLACWVGEVPEHDYHHRHSRDKNWVNGAYARQREQEAGCPGFPESYTEVWGIYAAIDRVFEALSQASVEVPL